MIRALPLVLSVFFFSVCISVAVPPAAITQGATSSISDHGLGELTDADLATVFGGDAESHDCTGFVNGLGTVLLVGGILKRDGFTQGLGHFLRGITGCTIRT